MNKEEWEESLKKEESRNPPDGFRRAYLPPHLAAQVRAFESNQERFEAWYINKFLRILPNAKECLIDLRNVTGGYDDPHIDGAFEAFLDGKN